LIRRGVFLGFGVPGRSKKRTGSKINERVLFRGKEGVEATKR